jgi:hypothetical protein
MRWTHLSGTSGPSFNVLMTRLPVHSGCRFRRIERRRGHVEYMDAAEKK